MKLTSCFLLLLSLTVSPLSADTTGVVFCDANQNGQFDSGDVPVPGVLVVVTNISGTFSNANWTASPDGSFVIDLGNVTDTFVEYILPATLPNDAVIVQPSGGVYTFTPDASNAFSGNFLISSSTCTNGTPPPPPPSTNAITCCLHAAGTIGGHPGRPMFVFAGSAVPSCGATNGDTGEWEILSHPLRLHFQGSVMDVVNCGQGVDAASNVFSYIEFQGAGTIKGIGNCHTNSGVVYFFGHAEDHGHHRHWQCDPDALYFRVYGADDSTLMLIGGDANNPSDVVPLPLSAGRLLINTNCCNVTSESDNDDQGDSDSEGSNHHEGDHDNQIGGGGNHAPSNGHAEHGSAGEGPHSSSDTGQSGAHHGASTHSNHGHNGTTHSPHDPANEHGHNDHEHGG